MKLLNLTRLELLTDDQYESAKTFVYCELIRIASSGDVCNYSDVCNKLRFWNIIADPFSSRLATLLGDISQEEFESNSPLLSAVVVNKESKKPGEGFFKLGKSLGIFIGNIKNEVDKDIFWVNALKETHLYWKEQFEEAEEDSRLYEVAKSSIRNYINFLKKTGYNDSFAVDAIRRMVSDLSEK